MCAFETEVHYSMILIQQNLKIPILLVPCFKELFCSKFMYLGNILEKSTQDTNKTT